MLTWLVSKYIVPYIPKWIRKPLQKALAKATVSSKDSAKDATVPSRGGVKTASNKKDPTEVMRGYGK